MKKRFLHFAEEHEVKLNVLFFIGGVIYDILTLGNIDSVFSIFQQIVYLVLIGFLLYYEFLYRFTEFKIINKLEKAWAYRDFALHFLMGALLSVYSIFFIKSSSFFSSVVFIVFMLLLMVANELKVVQQRQIGLKIALYLICLFSFFSMMSPIVFGYVGRLPFYTSVVVTAIVIGGIYKLISKKISRLKVLRSGLLYPTAIVSLLFIGFYSMGWIPPVPLSVKEMGLYHNIEKNSQGEYILSYERPQWKFWKKGDQDFTARYGDKIYLFVRIFSPTRFNDKVLLHWQKKVKGVWASTDKISMQISGGRSEGYRGYTYKENYSEGRWRVLVETMDEREIGRVYFDVTLSNSQMESEYNIKKR